MTIVEAKDLVIPPVEPSQEPADKKIVPENGPSGTVRMFTIWEEWQKNHAQRSASSSDSPDLRAGQRTHTSPSNA